MTDYKTVFREAEAEIVEKKSRFIASVRPVKNEEEALQHLADVRTQHRDARHHVYAYVCRENNISRYTDGGEPSGTAGLPVLNVLTKKELFDVSVIITRYFGGILLGAGGLARAYGKSAAEGIAAAGICKQITSHVFSVRAAYPLLGKLQHVIEEEDFTLLDTKYDADVCLTVCTESARGAYLQKKMMDVTDGKIKIEFLYERYVPKLIEE